MARPTWLTKNLATLSWVSLLQDAASEMLYPLLPALLNSVLHAPAAVIGMIEGLAEASAASTKLASSWMHQYLPKKSMIFIGYAGAAIGKMIVAAAAFWPMVMVGRVVDRLGKGMRSAARDALLVSEIDQQHRGRAIGLHRTADTTGAVIGPLLALALLSIFDNNLRLVLWCAVIPGILSTLMVLWVKDNDGRRPKTPRVRQASEERALPQKVNQSIAFLTIFGLLNFPDALILLHLGQIGFSITEVIGAYLLYNVAYAVLSFPAGALADRFKPNQIYAAGLIVFAATYTGFAFTTDKTFSLVLVMGYGAFAAANDSVGKSWIAKLAPDDRQLWAQSLLQGLGGFAILIAGIWAGLTWTLGSGFGSVPLAISGLLAMPIAVLMFRRH